MTPNIRTEFPCFAQISSNIHAIYHEAQANEIIHRAQQAFGRVDILVNNAGLVLLGLIDGANPEDWRRMVKVNILGSLYTTHAALPLMERQKSGHIVSYRTNATKRSSPLSTIGIWRMGGAIERVDE